MNKLYLTFALAAFSSLVHANEGYEAKLIGIWAMEPIKEVIPGAANVTEYREDGTYSLTSFRCTSDSEFLRAEEYDSEGKWRIEGNEIITSTSSEEVKEVNDQFEPIKEMFKNATDEERENFYKNAPAELIAYIEDKPIESIETIISLSDVEMNSKQKITPDVTLNLMSSKTDIISPNCSKFN